MGKKSKERSITKIVHVATSASQAQFAGKLAVVKDRSISWLYRTAFERVWGACRASVSSASDGHGDPVKVL